MRDPRNRSTVERSSAGMPAPSRVVLPAVPAPPVRVGWMRERLSRALDTDGDAGLSGGSAEAAAPGAARRYDRPPEHHIGVIRLHRPVDKFRARHGTVTGRGAGPRFGNSAVVVG